MSPLKIVKLNDLHQSIYNYIENNKVVISEYEDMKECILKMIREKYIFNMNRDRLRDAMEDITYMMSPDDEINKDRVEKGLEYEYSEDELVDSDEEDNGGMDMAGLSELQRILQSQIVNAANEVKDDETSDNETSDNECEESNEDEEVSDEEVADEEVADEEVADEEVADEEVAGEEVAGEEVSEEEVTGEEGEESETIPRSDECKTLDNTPDDDKCEETNSDAKEKQENSEITIEEIEE